MKKRIFILNFISLLIFTSCIDKESCDTTSNDVLCIKNKEGGVECIDASLHFNSSDSYFETIEFIMNASEIELDEWEKKIGFRSNRRLVNELFDEIDEIMDENEYYEFLKDNSDLINLEGDRLVPNIEDVIYSTIANSKGIFYLNGCMHKIQNNRVYYSDIIDLENIFFDPFAVYEDIKSYEYISTTNLKSTDCGNYQSAYKEIGKRRILLETYFEYINDTGYFIKDPNVPFSQKNIIVLSVIVTGEAKNIFGNWKSYKTEYKFNSGNFNLNIPYPNNLNNLPQASPIWPITDWSAESTYEQTKFWQYKYINKYPNTPYPNYIYFNDGNVNIADFNFTKTYIKATSRGIGYSNYATINCGS